MTAAQREQDQPGEQETPPAGPRAVRPTPSASVWWARLAHREPGPQEHSLVTVNSDRFPDGTAVDLTAVDPRGRYPAGWLVDVRYRAADGRVVRLAGSERVADPGLRLWFAEVSHATSALPATSLFAFAGDELPAGALVTPREVAARGLRMADRVGELRWWTRSGLVDTVRVEPAVRGRGLGRTLVHLAEGLAVLRGWARLEGELPPGDDAAAWLEAAPAHWRPRLRPAG